MIKLVVFLLIIAAMATWRFNFDRKYVMPAIKENDDLSILYTICGVFAAAIIVSMLLKQYVVMMIFALIALPIVLYFNFKAWRKSMDKYKSRK